VRLEIWEQPVSVVRQELMRQATARDKSRGEPMPDALAHSGDKRPSASTQ
jgi:hypothetical protein